MGAFALVIGWVFLACMGLVVLWAFCRFVLPWLVVLAGISFATYVGFQVYETHQRDLVSKAAAAEAHVEKLARSEAERATKSLAPKLQPRTKKAHRKSTIAPAASVEYCSTHPNAEVCEDRD